MCIKKDVSPPTRRVTSHIPLHVLGKLEYAVALVGVKLNQFMVQSSLKEADAVIDGNQEMQQILLSARDYQRMWDLIDNPPPANKKLLMPFTFKGIRSSLIHKIETFFKEHDRKVFSYRCIITLFLNSPTEGLLGSIFAAS